MKKSNKNRVHSPLQSGSGRAFRPFAAMALAAVMLMCITTPALAADTEPLAIMENLTDFIFSLIRGVGILVLGYGIMQVGLSFQSHDPSQRSNGLLAIVGGAIVTFTKEILGIITG